MFRCSYIYGLLLLVLQTSVWVYILICIAAACYDCSICRIDYRRYANAMKIGAGLQLVYLGVTSTPGGNVPSDPALAGCIAIPLGVAAGMNPETAIALAIPFGVLGVFVDQLRRTTNSIWVHMADKYAEKADTKGIMRAAFLYPAIAGFIILFPIVFIIDYFGVSVAQN